MRYFHIFILFFFCHSLTFAQSRAHNSTHDLIAAIIPLTQIQIPHNTTKAKLQCALNSTEQKSAELAYPDTFYEYYNALLETNREDIKLTELTQDLLIESVRYHNTPALLLGLQLYFSKQCERCERARDLSFFDYYRDRSVSMRRLLQVEGGSFATSYVLLGEAFLCRALQKKNANDYLMAYSNLMMAGLHTRAINALLQGLHDTNDSMLYATLQFLVSFDNVVARNSATVYFLRILRVQEKHDFSRIIALPYFQNLSVLEYESGSNYILQTLLLRDMDMGRILSPFSRLANADTKKEFWEKKAHYAEKIHEGNTAILLRATQKELQEYKKIVELKARLKRIYNYPFVVGYEEGFHN